MINQEKFNLTDKRFERKFILRDLNNIEIISSLFHSKCNFIEQFPERTVNSIYFDNHRYDSVHQNLDGVNDKIKFRVRWYGEKSLIVKPILEMKIKKDFQSIKKTKIIESIDNADYNLDSINQINKEVNKILNYNLKPVVSTHYKRIYLNSLQHDIRATIDYDLHYHNVNFFFKNDFEKQLKYKILELKYKSLNENHLKDLFDLKNLRVTKSSKYINSFIDQNYWINLFYISFDSS